MEIGKYIGKFLLKNKYCSLSGLGVFELKKASAAFNAGNQEIENPAYIITFSPVGSIDDTFASFIASHENVSISNASNNIKEYCKSVKDQVAKTGLFEIENLGKLTSVNGKLAFKQSADLDLGYQPTPVPVIEVAKQVTESPTDYSYPPARSSYARKNKNNWIKYFVAFLALALLVTGIYFGYMFMKNSQTVKPNEPVKETPPPIVPDSSQQIVVDTLSNTPAIDSMVSNKPTIPDSPANAAPAPLPPVNSGGARTLVIMKFANEAAANTKSNKLKSYGHNTAVVNSNGEFLLTLQASHPSNDTTILVDSIRRFFNPKGSVYILK